MNSNRARHALIGIVFGLCFLSLMLSEQTAYCQTDYDYTETLNPVAIYVRVDGVEGESFDIEHKGWIDAITYALDISSTAGRPEFRGVHIAKRIDLASPRLSLNAAMGSHIREVLIHFVRQGSDPFLFYEVQLQDAVITGISLNESLLEIITLNFSRIIWTYNAQKPDGSAGASMTYGWDLRKNQRIF